MAVDTSKKYLFYLTHDNVTDLISTKADDVEVVQLGYTEADDIIREQYVSDMDIGGFCCFPNLMVYKPAVFEDRPHPETNEIISNVQVQKAGWEELHIGKWEKTNWNWDYINTKI